ncbi:putative transposase [Streptomyces albus]|uniref:Putative transposase n=1 Tax=Streptomyces albus (strain ATCC 21838 / DSM 41398 / FERM P-419 / JCM 4703 / NBRC 107858) TaxID=1081613 RepID=A0A0B5F1B3_STRA4|nr:putative transposase [Streptomyces albus]AOU79637.1 putative transposase [Streptomyces albus]AYN35360.1 putative transposase [Streptomyces albus]
MVGDRVVVAASGPPEAGGGTIRQVLEGIVFKFPTGLPWRDLPERFGLWQTVL